MSLLPSFESFEIVNLVSIASPTTKTHKNTLLPYNAQARCMITTTDNTSRITQILGPNLNFFCTKSEFLWKPVSETLVFTPGFSYVKPFDAVWDPTTFTMAFSYEGTPIGQAVGTASLSLEKPLRGPVTLFITIDTDDGNPPQELSYTTTVEVYGYPAVTPWVTWGDWVSHGDVYFPMTINLGSAERLQLGSSSIIATYAVLADPLTVVESTDGGCDDHAQWVYPFLPQETASLYTIAQYQSSTFITYLE